MKRDSRLQIASALDRERGRLALNLLLGELDAEERPQEIERILTADATAKLSLKGLLLATYDDKPVGACFSLLAGDGSAFVWPPVTRSDGAFDNTNGILIRMVENALLQECWTQIGGAGAWLAQALLDPAAARQAEMLTRNGFTKVAELDYMELDLSNHVNIEAEALSKKLIDQLSDKRDPVNHGDSFEIEVLNEPTNTSRFAEMLERTYRNSLDCAALSGVRTGQEALNSHRISGESIPELWWLIREENTDVGVCLLTTHPDRASWEIVYLGIDPEHRGKALGRLVMEHVRQEARKAGRQRLELAVDCRNLYAMRIYKSLGFRTTERRSVFLRSARGLNLSSR